MGFTVVGKFPRIDKDAPKAIKTLPRRLANMAKNHFLKGFRRGGRMTNASRSGWAKRKGKKDSSRAILVKTGQLRNDIDVRFVSSNRAIVGTQAVKYAPFLNEGTSNMPAREFIGESTLLNKKILEEIEKTIREVFR